MKPIQFYLEEDVYRQLKQKALNDGLSVSELLRDAVSSVLSEPTDIVRTVTQKVAQEYGRKKDEEVASMAGVKLCKNGHLLNIFGRCMAKGCKYA